MGSQEEGEILGGFYVIAARQSGRVGGLEMENGVDIPALLENSLMKAEFDGRFLLVDADPVFDATDCDLILGDIREPGATC